MSKNGFFHQDPTGYDIYVADDMKAVVGRDQINGHVQNARRQGADIVADCWYNGQLYTAKSCQYGAESYWTIIAPVAPAWTAVFMTYREAYNQETNPVDLTAEEYERLLHMDTHASYSYMRYWRQGDDPANCGYHFFNAYKRP